MRKSYSKQDKEKIIKQYENGVPITSIHNSTGIARSTLYNCINEHNKAESDYYYNLSKKQNSLIEQG